MHVSLSASQHHDSVLVQFGSGNVGFWILVFGWLIIIHLSIPSCGWEQMKSEGSHGTPTMGEVMKSVGSHDTVVGSGRSQ
jgi:hypothetical protein